MADGWLGMAGVKRVLDGSPAAGWVAGAKCYLWVGGGGGLGGVPVGVGASGGVGGCQWGGVFGSLAYLAMAAPNQRRPCHFSHQLTFILTVTIGPRLVSVKRLLDAWLGWVDGLGRMFAVRVLRVLDACLHPIRRWRASQAASGQGQIPMVKAVRRGRSGGKPKR